MRSLLWSDQQRIRATRRGDFLDVAANDRCDAQLEFLNGFNSRFFVHVVLRIYCEFATKLDLLWQRVRESNPCTSLERAVS